MPARTTCRLLGFLGVSLALAAAVGVGLQAADLTHVSRSTGPTGYRGLVAANFDASDTRDEIVGDFGSIGVWLYRAGVWTQLTTQNPEWIFVVRWGDVSDYELIADFGAIGLWQWNYPSTWTRLTASNAEGGIAVDDEGDGKEELQIDFGALGLWRYDLDTATWSQLTSLNPSGTGLRTDLWTVGWEEGMWNFSSNGLWVNYWSGSSPSWTRLSASIPTEDFAAADFVDDDGTDTHDELAVEFSGLGTWLYNGDGSGTWTRLTATSADTMVPAKFGSNADWELIFADAGDTPWWYSGLAWERLTYSLMDRGFVVAFDPDAHATGEAAGETELATDFGTLGLWQYNYSTNSGYVNQWTQLTASNPVFMIPADYYADGHQTALIVNFGSGTGVWRYDGIARAWYKMTDSIPDSSLSW